MAEPQRVEPTVREGPVPLVKWGTKKGEAHIRIGGYGEDDNKDNNAPW